MKTTIKIVCGCNTLENPAVFNTLDAAQKHADTTGHTLTVSGIVTPDKTALYGNFVKDVKERFESRDRS